MSESVKRIDARGAERGQIARHHRDEGEQGHGDAGGVRKNFQI
jgi:hypothetical protein